MGAPLTKIELHTNGYWETLNGTTNTVDSYTKTNLTTDTTYSSQMVFYNKGGAIATENVSVTLGEVGSDGGGSNDGGGDTTNDAPPSINSFSAAAGSDGTSIIYNWDVNPNHPDGLTLIRAHFDYTVDGGGATFDLLTTEPVGSHSETVSFGAGTYTVFMFFENSIGTTQTNSVNVTL